MCKLDCDMKKYFPKLTFRLTDFQKLVIQNVIDNDSTMCIMPTGGGKSVIYWMSALELGGIAIIVSPLVALISEQAEKIREQDYEVLELHSGISGKKQAEILKQFAEGKIHPRFIFASPEKIATDGLFEYCLKQRKDEIKLMVIDEVHCVSQWGMSFRPFYKRIPFFLDALFGEKWCHILALTATLNPKELGDISNAFHISAENICKDSILMRSNIQLHVQKFEKEDEKEKRFWDIIKMHRGEKTLVYVYRKDTERGVEGLCQKAIDKGYHAAFFHGEMTPKERSEIIALYRNDEVDIIFATNAFGMGIDIPDIRVVIHFMIPESAEQYYQEVGRAARDKDTANAYLLYSNKNIEVKKRHFIDKSFPTEDKLSETYKKIGRKTGIKVFPYFEDDEIQNCLPYYMEAGLIKIVGKGFADLKDIENITDSKIKELVDNSKTKAFGSLLKKNDISVDELTDLVYGGFVNNCYTLKKALQKWLIIDVLEEEISTERMNMMLNSIAEKKEYKYELLDYFVYLLNEYGSNSIDLHKEIALYLGMDKYNLERVHETLDGNFVRSKSEVIISNLLFEAGIEYEYEKPLYYNNGNHIMPDFTLFFSNKNEIYWEHVGMLGKEMYDLNWSKKVDVYEKYFPNQMVKTYESGSLSRSAKKLIDELSDIYNVFKGAWNTTKTGDEEI